MGCMPPTTIIRIMLLARTKNFIRAVYHPESCSGSLNLKNFKRSITAKHCQKGEHCIIGQQRKSVKQELLVTYDWSIEITKFCMQFAAVPNSRMDVVELQEKGSSGSTRNDQSWFRFNLWFLSKHLENQQSGRKQQQGNKPNSTKTNVNKQLCNNNDHYSHDTRRFVDIGIAINF